MLLGAFMQHRAKTSPYGLWERCEKRVNLRGAGISPRTRMPRASTSSLPRTVSSK